MDRKNAILTIKNLYPANSDFPDVARKGQELLKQARLEVLGWQAESTEVLIRYAQLCLQCENDFKKEKR